MLGAKLGPLALHIAHPSSNHRIALISGALDWANFQIHLEDQIPFYPELHDGMAIDMCVENFSGAVLKALAASTPKRRPRADTRPPIPPGIQDEICLKYRLRRQCQITRDPTLRVEVNRLQRSVTRRLNE